MNKIIYFNIKKNINSKQNLFNGTCALKLEEKPDNDTELFIFDSLRQNESRKILYKEDLLPRETHIIDEYGNHFPQWSWIDNPRLQAKPYDRYNKMYYYFKRDLSATMRHFTAPDPVEPDIYNPITFNEYLAMNNNPIKYNDPTGEDITVIGWSSFTNPVSAYPHAAILIDIYDKNNNKVGQEYYDFEPNPELKNLWDRFIGIPSLTVFSTTGHVGHGPDRGGGRRIIIKTTVNQDKRARKKAIELETNKYLRYSIISPGISIFNWRIVSCISFVSDILNATNLTKSQKIEALKSIDKIIKESPKEIKTNYRRIFDAFNNYIKELLK